MTGPHLIDFRHHWAERVGAADGTLGRGLRVERDDGRPFGSNSGSVLVAQAHGGRQRAPSRKPCTLAAKPRCTIARKVTGCGAVGMGGRCTAAPSITGSTRAA